MLFEILFVAASANAENSLFRACEAVMRDPQNAASIDVGYCGGYMAGFNWGIYIGNDGNPDPVICLPDALTPEQALRVYVQYVNANPGIMHLDEEKLILNAFVESFPCRKQN